MLAPYYPTLKDMAKAIVKDDPTWSDGRKYPIGAVRQKLSAYSRQGKIVREPVTVHFDDGTPITLDMYSVPEEFR